MLPRESGQSRVPDPPAMMTPYSMYIAYPRSGPRPPVQLYRSRKRRGMRYNGMQFLPRRIYENHAPAVFGDDDWGRVADGRRRDGILIWAAAGDGGGGEAGAVAGEIGLGNRADGARAGG